MSSDDGRGGASSSRLVGLDIYVAFHEEEWELQSTKKDASRDSRMEARHVTWT
jgi:hypothetical protein